MRPLSRATHLVHLLTGEDDSAVDDPRRDRGELPADRADHGLVQQRQALFHSARLDQLCALHRGRQRKCLRVSEALGHCGRLARHRGARLEVAGSLVLEGERHEHVAVLDRLVLLAFEQPLRSAEPPAGRPHLPTQREVHAHPERGANRA